MSKVSLENGFNMRDLRHKVDNFSAGHIKNFVKNWKELTSDRVILDIVEHGLKLNFSADIPRKGPFEYPRSKRDTGIITEEVEKLLLKGVITKSNIADGDYFSSLFTTPKKDGSYRTILNLKYLNEECDTHHFKMESLKQAIHMIRRGAFLASIDIKDAFYSVPIHPSHKKYQKFVWLSTPYQFEAMPNGYKDAMRVFTKLLKPVFSHLREMGYISIIYVDDTLLYGDTFEECLENVQITLHMLQELGFVVHSEKSVLWPSQQSTFLGFEFDTIAMTITLTKKKKQKIILLAIDILARQDPTIRLVSKFLGNVTASFEAVPEGRIHYRHIEFDKKVSLKMSHGNYDGPCFLSEESLGEILWWKNNINESFAYIKATPLIDYVVYTDASNEGWGAADKTLPSINGRWSWEEQFLHINVLELKAIELAILAYLPLQPEVKHLRIKSDNTTAISYINKQGGTHCMLLNDMAVNIWKMCLKWELHISASHIPGAHNVLADTASREFNDSSEWAIPEHVFDNLVNVFGMPDIDLFASRLNRKLDKYASWKPDPESQIIDAMSVSWTNYFVYIFPPFSMVWPILSKLEQDRVERAIIVFPKWPTQSWYPRLLRKAIADPIPIPSKKLILPGTTKSHPLSPKLRLLAVLCSWRDKMKS